MSKTARRYWASLFAVGAGLAILVNAAQAKGALALPGTWTAVGVAAAPPAIFAGLALGWHLTGRGSTRRVRVLTGGAVGVLAVATFAVSYETQRAFVVAESGPLPAWVGWVIPGMLDTLVAVSGLAWFAHHESASQPADTTPDGEIKAAARDAMSSVFRRFQRTMDAPSRRESPQVDSASRSADAVHNPSHDAAVTRAATNGDASHDAGHGASANRATARHEPGHEPPVNRATTQPVARREPLSLPGGAPAVARRIVETTAITQPVEVVERVLELAADGKSQREIEKQVTAVSASTARRIIAAAREIADSSDSEDSEDSPVGDHERQRQLAAVH